MKHIFDPSPAILTPGDLVRAVTGKEDHDLALPERAVLTFNTGDMRKLVVGADTKTIEAWSRFRPIYRLPDTDTVVTRSYFGGSNVAAVVEELSTFGVHEFILWGYCGALSEQVSIGDVLIAKGALREEGVSYHYLPTDDDFVYSNWYREWEDSAKENGFREALIWSCDALYRETADKIKRYRQTGISGVEMEVASLYAVCEYKGLKGIAFLVVSDSFSDGAWQSGFSANPFRKGVARLTAFILENLSGGRN